MKKQILNNENELLELAESFGRSLNKKDIIILNGPLGAGKTCFVKGIAKSLGIKQMITFVKQKINSMKKFNLILLRFLFHVNLYILSPS